LKRAIKNIARKILQAILSPDEPYNPLLEGAVVFGENKNNICIGKNVTFGGNVYIHADATVYIGDNTMIAYGCIIHTSTHDYNGNPMWEKRIDAPIKIGNHVWLGTGAIILSGVIIEDYAVIGSGTVVSKNVPKGAVLVGNPAKISKFRTIDSYEKPQSINTPNQAQIIKKNYCNTYYK